MEENNNQQVQAKENLRILLISIIIVGLFVYGVFHYFYVIEPKKQKQESTVSNILSALNQSGYEYTNKSTFTEEDFTSEEVVESDYKPIYKVNISNGDVLYICLIYTKGNKGGYKTNERFIISRDLERLKNTINNQ